MKVFLSYSSKDRELVQYLRERLEAARHEVWMDVASLQPGDIMLEKVTEALSQVDVFMPVVSANSLSSSWVASEISTAAIRAVSDRSLLIIPVLIDQSSMPSYLSAYYYVDLSKKLDEGINLLLTRLAGKKPKQSAKNEPPAEPSPDNHLEQLRSSLRDGRLTVFCGAGVSVEAGIPAWNQLLMRLLQSMLDRISKDHSVVLGGDAAKQFANRYGSSALILGKYLRNNLRGDFETELRRALYLDNPTTCKLIDAIAELSRPQRDSKALDSIVTFNFDGLIEEQLGANRIPNRPIFTEGVKHSSAELPVYHVHGYLPRSGDIPLDTSIVFSEDAYHTQFLDPFSWSNLIQLGKLTQQTCLFIGISLTDPNMRRLLDVAWRKNPESERNHFIFKRRPKTADGKEDDWLAHLLEEQDANALGLNVIWIDKFDEIPDYLSRIAEH